MSIFPKRTNPKDIYPHKQGADAPSHSHRGRHPGLRKAQDRDLPQHDAEASEGGPPNKSADDEKEKDHRFDKFARKMGESMIEAIRVTLSVFSSPDKERWPASKLLDYLKGAEALARDMLREIAEKIFVYPPPARAIGAVSVAAASEANQMRLPCFRLDVNMNSEAEPGRSPEAADAAEPEGRTSDAQAQRPGEAGTAASTIEKRLATLQDVLAHPGKHAARMARALYRSENEDGARLIARSQNELMLDHGDFLASDPAYARSEAAWRMQRLFIDPG